MRFDILTLFPEQFVSFQQSSIMKRAWLKGIYNLTVWNIRDYTEDKHHQADDYPFGGGAGMLLQPEPLQRALEAVLNQTEPIEVIYLSPGGIPLEQKTVQELSKLPRLLLICGHYEGIDQRIISGYVHREISIGDYVLSGGELAAMVLMDAIIRLLPGALGSAASLQQESFSDRLLEYPQYTRPALLGEQAVPEILLSGNHSAIAAWQRRQALSRTLERRPDLLLQASLSESDRLILKQLLREARYRSRSQEEEDKCIP